MENIKTCELCLEQIVKTEDFENLKYDEKQNLTILKNLEINVSRDAIICSNCVNASHLTYNFKTFCLTNNDHLKTLIHPGINDKLILEEVVVEETKSEFKNEKKVCRFCLNFTEVNSLVEVNLEQDVVLKDMLGRCLPEIDANIVQNPLICSICSELLKKLFNFISQCKHIEVLGNLDTKTDSLVSENKPNVTIANNDNNINESFLKEEICDGLEDFELQIKSEDFDIDEHIKESINDSNSLLKEGELHEKPSSFRSGLTDQRIHGKTRKSTINKLYKCTKCFFQSKYQGNLIKHKKRCEKASKCNICCFTASNKCEIVKHKKEVHQYLAEPRLFKCQKCPYITKWSGTLNSHNIRWHSYNISKRVKYKCDECPYETLFKCALFNHKLTHRDPSEVNMYKCMKCSYQTKRKDTLQRHEKKHATLQQNVVKVEQRLRNSVEEKNLKPKPDDTINKKQFVCDICSYQAATKYLLRQHCLIHKEPSEVKVFECDYCPFTTKWKQSLTAHTILHKNPSELPKFKCNDCPYEAIRKSQLVRHNLAHKNPSQVNVYKCNLCPYETKYRGCIQVHNKYHQLETYTHDKCNYKTMLKKSFMVQSQCPKDCKQLTKSNSVEENDVKLKPRVMIKKKKFVCDICSYQTTRKYTIQKHCLIHKKPSEVNVFKCDYCPFATKWKPNLRVHAIRHKNPSDLPKFKCNDCSYETNNKRYLVNHVQVHKNPSQVVNLYKCKVCPYQAKCKCTKKSIKLKFAHVTSAVIKQS